LVTAIVATWKVALVPPPATVTLAGTVATDVLLLDSETAAPPLGAGPLRVTRPVDGTPPLTLVGLSVSVDSVREAGGPDGPGVPGPGPALELELLPPHEYKASENVTIASAVARPRRGRAARPKWQSIAQPRRPATHPSNHIRRTADNPEDELMPMNPAGIAAARAVVCTVTVAVAGLAPLSVTALGLTAQTAAGGAPPHVNAMV
jgi:hypothetical protein